MEEPIEDSNSLFSGSNHIAPLAKRQTVSKREDKGENNLGEKIEELGYQVIEELGIITALDVHPNRFS